MITRERSRNEKEAGDRLKVSVQKKRDDRVDCDRSHRHIQRIITNDQPALARLVLGQRLGIQAKDFGQQAHAHLGEEHAGKPQPECIRAEGFAEIIGNTHAKTIGQRGKKNKERTGEAEKGSQFGISDFRFIIFPDKYSRVIALEILPTVPQPAEGFCDPIQGESDFVHHHTPNQVKEEHPLF